MDAESFFRQTRQNASHLLIALQAERQRLQTRMDALDREIQQTRSVLEPLTLPMMIHVGAESTFGTEPATAHAVKLTLR